MTDLFAHRAPLYEALVDWPKRLANESPFYRAQFARHGVRRVLDAACGTGQHAALFAGWGLDVTGADLSPAMIARCCARDAAPGVRWLVHDFLEPHAPGSQFDAVICVGNSLALLPDAAAVGQALAALLASLRPGGIGVFHVVNLWSIAEGPCTWQKCRRATIEGTDHVLLKGIHRVGAVGHVEFAAIALEGGGATPVYDTARFLGFERAEFEGLARAANAAEVEIWGDYQQRPFDRARSPDLLAVVTRG